MVGIRSTARLALFIVALCAHALTGCGDDPFAPELQGDNLLELTADSEDLTLIRDILGDLALSGTLRTGDDLTFFAPTDEALLSLGADMLGRLRLPNNQAILDKIVRRHVVRGRFRTEDLRDGMALEPLAGPPLTVSVDGDDITVGGAVLDDDFTTSNGVLHLVEDEVIRDHLTLAERLRVTPIVRSFADALGTADLTGELADRDGPNDGPVTLFIPINSAFAAFTPFELQSLLSFANRDVLRKVLRHHAVAGRVQLDDLTTGTALEALDGSALEVVTEGGVTFVGGARVVVPEVATSDGLIYLLDEVVLGHLDLGERLQIAPEFFTSFTILGDAGILGELEADGDYTVFATPEASWERLGLPFIPELNALPDLLLRTAQYAVVPGRVEPEDLLGGGDLTTLGDYTLPVQVRQDVGGPQVFVGGRGQVELTPREASNGLIYTVAPFYFPPNLDLEERAVFTALYRFLNQMERAGLTSILREPGPYTVFAPTDDALEGVIIPTSQLASTMRYHIVPGLFTAGGFTGRDTLTTLEGSPLEVWRLNGLSLNCVEIEEPPAIECPARVTEANAAAENGVIHTIDSLLEIPTP